MKNYTLLQQHKLKATPQRLAIIELMEYHGHISIDDLYSSIRQIFSSISLATLYKNIHSMMGVNLIREVKVPGQKTHYEIEKERHAHILCTQCGELKDIEFDPQSFIQLVASQSAYKTEEVSVIISGICPKCQKK
ncbi:MAG: Fur family transcriptional regulator [Sulfuricurvum sp.]|uniref:Fur family transcriptional regulator n=1 Tax=Sulfuricurvum sp. TaxID=2025608 RepID=UPI00260D41AF|nr:Fur family transcriptional regulator [Sulfuricurvum sp.]MDD2829079.1 Fur family transcriptional regulator [Sulfuricurvum sp.]MDD4948827.1 Fur family transcriptional regulator [Sulfuricurvum sp.]